MKFIKFDFITINGTTGFCRTTGCNNSVNYGEIYCFYCKIKMGM